MWGGGGDCTRIFCAKLKQKLLSAAEKHPKIPCELESKGAWGTQKKIGWVCRFVAKRGLGDGKKSQNRARTFTEMLRRTHKQKK